MHSSPPASETELLTRARSLAGRTLAQIGAGAGVRVPNDLRRAKGWVGTLLERVLGATASSKAMPDFETLGVELKSIPVNRLGSPLETTFVCTIPLLDVGDVEWKDSWVRRKLSRVLWVPVLGERSVPVPERVVGSPVLWSPTAEQEADLRWDWEELAGVIGRGDVDDVSGHLGKCLQIRPKAANSAARRGASDAEGSYVSVLPRGFYLRPSFTGAILNEHLRLPAR